MAQAAGLAAVIRPSWVQKSTPSEACANRIRQASGPTMSVSCITMPFLQAVPGTHRGAHIPRSEITEANPQLWFFARRCDVRVY